jgi:hypothetical protein
MQRGFAVFSLVILFSLAITTMSTQAESEALFTLTSQDPAIQHGASGTWDGLYTDPGAVMYHDGKFHMFRNGFPDFPAPVGFAYLTSDDGIHWTSDSSDPVLHSKDIPFVMTTAFASSVLVEPDGTWVLYFYTWEPKTRVSPGIGRATAKAPQGPWTVDPQPILTAGIEGSWDDLRLTFPRVMKTETGYLMYYTGNGKRSSAEAGIGMATSSDGLTWAKHDDPNTTALAYTASDPVLVSHDENRVYHFPIVFETDDGWQMLFKVTRLDQEGGMIMRHATSADGIIWKVFDGAPVWTTNVIDKSDLFWTTGGVYHEGTYYLYVEGQRGVGTDIYVGTLKGELPS